MDTELIKNNFTEAYNLLNEFLNNDKNIKAIERAGEIMVNAINKGNKIISCGNGGSMSDAMHFAEELTGRFRENRPGIPAIAISDPAYLTCTANDFGFKKVFSRFIESMGKSGDVLLAISTSGNSQNIINAVTAAKNNNITTVCLTGGNGGKLKDLCDVEIRVAHHGYSDRIQEIHIKIIHSLVEITEKNIFE